MFQMTWLFSCIKAVVVSLQDPSILIFSLTSFSICAVDSLEKPFESAAAPAAKSLQSGLTLCDPIDGSPPGSPVPEILQARTLEWVSISFSNAWKWKVKVKSLSNVQLLATPWTAAYQASLSMGFSRQEYWSGVPLSSLLNQLDVCVCVCVSYSMVFSSCISSHIDIVNIF